VTSIEDSLGGYHDWTVVLTDGNDHSVSGVLLSHQFEEEIIVRGKDGATNFWAPKNQVRAIFREGHELALEYAEQQVEQIESAYAGKCDSKGCGCA
jgi:hypothetical protein